MTDKIRQTADEPGDLPRGWADINGDQTEFAPVVAAVNKDGTALGSAAAGTQYTEDAASAANPVGNMLIVRRRDTLTGAEVTTENDNIAVNATSKGEVYVKQSDSVITAGDVAHDGADSGSPVKVGGKAIAGLSGTTLVAAADRTNLQTGLDGSVFVRETPFEDIVSGVVAITDGSSTSVIASSGAGVKTYITDVTIANTSATVVNVDLRDGTAGSVKWTFPVPANTAGVVYAFRTPLPFSAATAVAADPSASASTVTVSLGGFKSKI